jgi:hypothetical protein
MNSSQPLLIEALQVDQFSEPAEELEMIPPQKFHTEPFSPQNYGPQMSLNFIQGQPLPEIAENAPQLKGTND